MSFPLECYPRHNTSFSVAELICDACKSTFYVKQIYLLKKYIFSQKRSGFSQKDPLKYKSKS